MSNDDGNTYHLSLSERIMRPTTQYTPCPNCGQSNAKKVNYTWWGGMFGPNILTHVKCQNCGTQNNGKTGKSNQTNILIILSLRLSFSSVHAAGWHSLHSC